MAKQPYGQELILDLHNCDPSYFTRDNISRFFDNLCEAIGMQACDRHFWDDLNVPEDERQTEPHTKGTSAIQFILTSNITIHTLDDLRCVYVNIFSCKPFDKNIATAECLNSFGGQITNSQEVNRL